MNYEQMNNNKVLLRGRIMNEPVFSHEVMGEGFYDFKLTVPRLSGQEDMIDITVSERLMKGSDMSIGKILTINGQYRSYNKIEDEKSRLLLTCFVRDMFNDDFDDFVNIVELKGHICKKPVYRLTPFKREICDILIAVNRAYNKSDYIPCIAWGRNAKFLRDLEVGEKISVAGRIQSREYHKQLSSGETVNRVAYEISLNKVELIENGGFLDRSYNV